MSYQDKDQEGKEQGGTSSLRSEGAKTRRPEPREWVLKGFGLIEGELEQLSGPVIERGEVVRMVEASPDSDSVSRVEADAREFEEIASADDLTKWALAKGIAIGMRRTVAILQARKAGA